MLYFQNEYDRPVVTGCVRKNGDACGRCANPNNRYYATESGNYLDMLPGAVNLYRGGMHVCFNDENGISMSAGSVSISGSKKLIVSKSKGGFISLEGELYNEASVVYENGSCRELFAPFTDDVPDLGELLAIQSQLNLNRFNPTMDLMSAMAGSQAKAGECYITKSPNSKSENSNEPSTIDKILDFLGLQTYCYAATKDEASQNTSNNPNKNIEENTNKDISISNNPIQFIGKNNIDKFNPSADKIEIKGEECYITQDSGNSRQINEYEYDAEKVRNAKHIEDKVKYLFKYEYDRVITYDSEIFKYIALIDGMDPKYAQLYGDFTAGMIVESALTISISGIKSGNALINGEVISKSDIVVGSGAGNLAKVKNPTRKQLRQIEDLRNGKDVSVNTVEEARALLDLMPDVTAPPLGRMNPEFLDPKGTYRGDLINKNNPLGPVHDPNVVQANPNHAKYPHYNIRFKNGEKAAILIDGV